MSIHLNVILLHFKSQLMHESRLYWFFFIWQICLLPYKWGRRQKLCSTELMSQLMWYWKQYFGITYCRPELMMHFTAHGKMKQFNVSFVFVDWGYCSSSMMHLRSGNYQTSLNVYKMAVEHNIFKDLWKRLNHFQWKTVSLLKGEKGI